MSFCSICEVHLPDNSCHHPETNKHLGSIFNYEKESAELYRQFVTDDSLKTMEHALLGLCAESGEVADVYKKSLYQNTPIDKEKMLLELGDVRWYLELCCILLDTNLIELEALNIEKLTKRRAGQK